VSNLLLQDGDGLLLQAGDHLVLAGPVFSLSGTARWQGDAAAQWLGRIRPVAGHAGVLTALVGALARVGKVEPSPDVVAYSVYRAMDAPIRLASPYSTVAGPPWTDAVFDDWTGAVTYLVRAVDVDGNEEGNIREVLVVPVQNGVVGVALPAEPRIVGRARMALRPGLRIPRSRCGPRRARRGGRGPRLLGRRHGRNGLLRAPRHPPDE